MKQLNPANVLAAIRDREANTLEDLCAKFGLDPLYGRYYLDKVLQDLDNAGLILHEGAGSNVSGRIEVIPNLRKMQSALGFSLKTLGQAGPDSLTVQPHFGKPAGFPTPLDVFVVMAFKAALRPIYEIGMAHTLGRTVIMITQDKKDVPFDLQSIRFILYEYTPPGMVEFEERLTQAVKAELGMTAEASKTGV